jgi:hypothetical protein
MIDKKLIKSLLEKTASNEIEKHINALDYFTTDIPTAEKDSVVELFKSSYEEVQKKLTLEVSIEFKNVPMSECIKKFLEDEEDYWYTEFTQDSFMSYKYFDAAKLDELVDDIDNDIFDLDEEYLQLAKEGAINLANYIRLFGINKVFKYE